MDKSRVDETWSHDKDDSTREPKRERPLGKTWEYCVKRDVEDFYPGAICHNMLA